MKKILMIATGGTIASKKGGDGLTPAMTGEELAANVPGIEEKCDLTVLQLMNIDSTNMRPRQWIMISVRSCPTMTVMTVLSFFTGQIPWPTLRPPCPI